MDGLSPSMSQSFRKGAQAIAPLFVCLAFVSRLSRHQALHWPRETNPDCRHRSFLGRRHPTRSRGSTLGSFFRRGQSQTLHCVGSTRCVGVWFVRDRLRWSQKSSSSWSHVCHRRGLLEGSSGCRRVWHTILEGLRVGRDWLGRRCGHCSRPRCGIFPICSRFIARRARAALIASRADRC